MQLTKQSQRNNYIVADDCFFLAWDKGTKSLAPSFCSSAGDTPVAVASHIVLAAEVGARTTNDVAERNGNRPAATESATPKVMQHVASELPANEIAGEGRGYAKSQERQARKLVSGLGFVRLRFTNYVRQGYQRSQVSAIQPPI